MKLAPLTLFALMILAFSAPLELSAAVSSEKEGWVSVGKIRRDRTAVRNRDFAARVPRSFGSSVTAQLRCLSKVPGVYQRLCDDVLNSEYLLKQDTRLSHERTSLQIQLDGSLLRPFSGAMPMPIRF
jgi:hypothetical protein